MGGLAYDLTVYSYSHNIFYRQANSYNASMPALSHSLDVHRQLAMMSPLDAAKVPEAVPHCLAHRSDIKVTRSSTPPLKHRIPLLPPLTPSPFPPLHDPTSIPSIPTDPPTQHALFPRRQPIGPFGA